MPVPIHGKQYTTVAERLKEAHKKYKDGFDVLTELVSNDPVIFKATVVIEGKTYTGYSSVNPGRGTVERTSPYETCETSAVGRALAFAGFATDESIASAEEMEKAIRTEVPVADMITTPQIRKIAVMLPQTKYGTIEKFEEETGLKIKTFTKKKATELIAKLEDASMEKVMEDDREAHERM